MYGSTEQCVTWGSDARIVVRLTSYQVPRILLLLYNVRTVTHSLHPTLTPPPSWFSVSGYHHRCSCGSRTCNPLALFLGAETEPHTPPLTKHQHAHKNATNSLLSCCEHSVVEVSCVCFLFFFCCCNAVFYSLWHSVPFLSSCALLQEATKRQPKRGETYLPT